MTSVDRFTMTDKYKITELLPTSHKNQIKARLTFDTRKGNCSKFRKRLIEKMRQCLQSSEQGGLFFKHFLVVFKFLLRDVAYLYPPSLKDGSPTVLQMRLYMPLVLKLSYPIKSLHSSPPSEGSVKWELSYPSSPRHPAHGHYVEHPSL
jgi:hypothetical protein